MSDNRCAIYMKADPFMKKDLDIIKRVQRVFHHVDIILDRKWQNEKYLLSFQDRADIIRHDLAAAKIEDYKILANDTSRYDSALKEGVKNVAVEVNQYTKLDALAERDQLVRSVISDVNVVFIPQFGDNVLADNLFLRDMIMEDSTHTLYKKYISDYAYIKTKLKLMTKIGLTGNRGCGLKIVLEQFKDRGYEVIDLDQMLIKLFKEEDEVKKLVKALKNAGIQVSRALCLDSFKTALDKDKIIKLCLEDQEAKEAALKSLHDSLYMKLAEFILKSTSKIIIVSSTLLFEFKTEWMFDKIITVLAPDEVQRQRMRDIRGYPEEKIEMIMKLHMPISEKVKRSSYYIDSGVDEESTKRNTISLINYRIEKGF